MRMTNSKMRSTAIAALLCFPVATGTALAQQSQETDQTQPQPSQAQEATEEQSSQSVAESEQAGGDQQPDAVVATVGEADILNSDVMTVIGMLPPQLQAQPPQMLVPMALEQLILRELIIEEARGQNLADDPEVVALVESSAQTAEEEAMVQVWLDREMADVVTDEAVQEVYEGAEAQGQQDLPPLEEVRPQIEQHLRQQAMRDIQVRLREGADIVLYDPTGRPVEQQQSGQSQQDQGTQDNAGESGDSTSDGQSSGGNEGTGSPSDGQSGDGATSSDAAGEQIQND